MGPILGFIPLLSFVPANYLNLTIFIYIYVHRNNPWNIFQENPLTILSPWWGSTKKTPPDNWDTAQTSFELPWQICFSLNLETIPWDSIFICSTLRNAYRPLLSFATDLVFCDFSLIRLTSATTRWCRIVSIMFYKPVRWTLLRVRTWGLF